MRKFISFLICTILCLQFSSCDKALPINKAEVSSNDTEAPSNDIETPTNTDTEESLADIPLLSVKNGKLDFPDGVLEYVEARAYRMPTLNDAIDPPSHYKEISVKYYSSADSLLFFFKNIDLGAQVYKEDSKLMSGNRPFHIIFCYEDGSKFRLGYDLGYNWIFLGEENYDINAYYEEFMKLIKWP